MERAMKIAYTKKLFLYSSQDSIGKCTNRTKMISFFNSQKKLQGIKSRKMGQL